MNICIVSGESRFGKGGLAAYMRLLARHLAESGHCISTVCRFDQELPGELNYDKGESGSGRVIDGIATQLIGPRFGTRALLRQLHHFTGRRRLWSLAVNLFSWAYRPALREAIPAVVDVIHFVGTGWELLGFAALREARRRKAAFTIWPAVHAGTWGDSPLDIALYDQADAVFCQSDHELEHLAGLGVARHRLTRAWLAPATDPTGDGSRFREKYGLGERPLALFIARKVRSKGFHVLCEAMERVLIDIPDCCLVAVGPEGEPPYPPVPAGAYLDLGPTDDATKADALAACDVFCMPSAAESFGIVYVEAWSYGKPVIGGPATAVRELIREGIDGLCVTQSATEIGAKLTALLRDESSRERMGSEGRRRQIERYNWNAVSELHRAAFAKLKFAGVS